METIKIRILMVASFILFIVAMGTCRLKKFGPANTESPKQDTAFIHRLTQEKIELQAHYENTIAQLKAQRDSFAIEVQEKKRNLTVYRFKTELLESKLREQLEEADSTGLCPDSLTRFASDYIEAQNVKDSLCSETILSLEQTIACQDSSELIHRQAEINLKGLVNLEQIKGQSFTDQLHLQDNELKKKTRQNKLLRGSLYILTGITSALIIQRALK